MEYLCKKVTAEMGCVSLLVAPVGWQPTFFPAFLSDCIALINGESIFNKSLGHRRSYDL